MTAEELSPESPRESRLETGPARGELGHRGTRDEWRPYPRGSVMHGKGSWSGSLVKGMIIIDGAQSQRSGERGDGLRPAQAQSSYRRTPAPQPTDEHACAWRFQAGLERTLHIARCRVALHTCCCGTWTMLCIPSKREPVHWRCYAPPY